MPEMQSYTIALWTRSYATESIDTMSTLADRKAYQLLHYQSSTMPNGLWFSQTYAQVSARSSEGSRIGLYLPIYLALCFTSVVFGSLKFFMAYYAGFRASQSMFKKMLAVILRAPLRFLDTTPTGRILNR